MFSKVLGFDTEQCPSCDDIDRLVKLPGCGHQICVECVHVTYLNNETHIKLAGKCPTCQVEMKPAWKSS